MTQPRNNGTVFSGDDCMEYSLMILNSIIQSSRGSFKLGANPDGSLVMSARGFKYIFADGFLSLEGLTNANAYLTAAVGVEEDWLPASKDVNGLGNA